MQTVQRIGRKRNAAWLEPSERGGAPTTYMCERRSACLMPNGLRMSRQLVRARRVRRCSFG